MHRVNVKLIFQRELRDQLRDRRTMFMILVLPVLIYPALGLGLVTMTVSFGEKPKRIGIFGVEYLPSQPPLRNPKGDRFHHDLFKTPLNQKYFHIIAPGSANRPWTPDDFVTGKIDVLIEFPAETSALLAQGKQVKPKVLYDGTKEGSQIAFQATMQLLKSWGREIVRERMVARGEPKEFVEPIDIEEDDADIVPAEERSGMAWGKFFPFVIVLMTLTGAFYPAIDLCAGEKERGTMETLLITPAARGDIVLGKFLTIFVFSVATTFFNVLSMGLTFGQISNVIPESAREMADQFATPGFAAILWMLVLTIPLAAFFSATCMALAIFARSTKEGQYYLMPTFLAVAPLTFLTLAPGVELSFFYSLVPVTNVALLLRALMFNQYEKAAVFLLPVLAPTVLYCYIALRAALEQFNREEVLFREAERFELGLWIRHLFRDKEPLPSLAEAWCCYVLTLLLLWYSQGHFPQNIASQAVIHIAFIAFPALLMGLMLTTDPRRTLGLRRPRFLPSLLAVATALSIHPIAVTAATHFDRLFVTSQEFQSASMFSSNSPLLVQLLFAGILPAVCAEIAFRGFILSGLMRRYSPTVAITITSLLFGVSQLVTPQMIMASLLGVILGIVTTRAGSILPAMALHAVHRCLLIVSREQDISNGAATDTPIHWIVLSALVSALVIGYLAGRPMTLAADKR